MADDKSVSNQTAPPALHSSSSTHHRSRSMYAKRSTSPATSVHSTMTSSIARDGIAGGGNGTSGKHRSSSMIALGSNSSSTLNVKNSLSSDGSPLKHAEPVSNAAPAVATNIQVAVRCRPLNNEEKNNSQSTAVTVDLQANTIKVSYGQAIKKISRTIEFDRVFGMYSRQNEVYDNIVKPIVDEAMAGFNCTIFAYGPTGTGKTHTMEGNISDENEGWGMIPRVAKTIFETLSNSNNDFTVKVSYLEICKFHFFSCLFLFLMAVCPLFLACFLLIPPVSIYQSISLFSLDNEELQDLLCNAGDKRLKLMEDLKRGVVCHNLEEFGVFKVSDVIDFLKKGSLKRQTAATRCNDQSSRSHAIFTFRLTIKEMNDTSDIMKQGQINLVDLAGSESIGRSGRFVCYCRLIFLSTSSFLPSFLPSFLTSFLLP
jgi:hypothetical protein